jgi:hypothetical protein
MKDDLDAPVAAADEVVGILDAITTLIVTCHDD